MRQAAMILVTAFACSVLAVGLAVWQGHAAKRSSIEKMDVLAAKNAEQRGFSAPATATAEGNLALVEDSPR